MPCTCRQGDQLARTERACWGILRNLDGFWKPGRRAASRGYKKPLTFNLVMWPCKKLKHHQNIEKARWNVLAPEMASCPILRPIRANLNVRAILPSFHLQRLGDLVSFPTETYFSLLKWPHGILLYGCVYHNPSFPLAFCSNNTAYPCKYVRGINSYPCNCWAKGSVHFRWWQMPPCCPPKTLHPLLLPTTARHQLFFQIQNLCLSNGSQALHNFVVLIYISLIMNEN